MEIFVGDGLLFGGYLVWKSSTGSGLGAVRWGLADRVRKYGGIVFAVIGLCFVTHAWLIR